MNLIPGLIRTTGANFEVTAMPPHGMEPRKDSSERMRMRSLEPERRHDTCLCRPDAYKRCNRCEYFCETDVLCNRYTDKISPVDGHYKKLGEPCERERDVTVADKLLRHDRCGPDGKFWRLKAELHNCQR